MDDSGSLGWVGNIAYFRMRYLALEISTRIVYTCVEIKLKFIGEEMFVFKKVLIVLLVTGFLLTACSGQKVRDSIEVQINLTEFGIESSVTDFESGVLYRFIVTNAGTVEHEFMIMPPLTADEMGMGMDMGEMDQMALAMIATEKLQPGVTATLDFSFTETAPAGALELACHTPGHYEANMKLPITVK
ncbi:hypothetical protein [Candidatus Villigracilis affinis]|uniref:hypothetical protein n=1 Tax=Candidatus Villigracilis affinis TaxID=3140682 RepID=UPI002A1B8060|nr:hypothetical protein [Anaerolineales bacterium]